MDGVVAASTPTSASARLRAEALALRESAERDQIEPGGTLGHWLRGQETALLGLAEMADHLDRTAAYLGERVHSAIQNTRELSVSEVRKLQLATALAETTIGSLKATESVLKLRTDQAVANLIASLKPDLIKELSRTTVIRERQWNMRQNVAGVMSIAFVIVGLFAIGYFMGGGDLRSREQGYRAQAAVARCLSSAQPMPLTAESTCSASSLMELRR